MNVLYTRFIFPIHFGATYYGRLHISLVYLTPEIHGFIISGKNRDQPIGKQADELKIVKSGIVSIKNVMSLTESEEIMIKSRKSPIRAILIFAK